MTLPRPLFTAAEAVARARSAVGSGTYELGTGDVDTVLGGPSDCCGFATCWCFGIRRHRPGFNLGAWATVEDDTNCNSSIEDAQHAQDLFEIVTGDPQEGDLVKYPTIHIVHDGTPMLFCGHEAIIVGVARAAGKWNAAKPDYSLLDVVQCCGPNGHHPGIIASDGSIWRQHDSLWPLPQHKTWLLRVKP